MSGRSKRYQGLRASQMLNLLKENVPGTKRKVSISDDEDENIRPSCYRRKLEEKDKGLTENVFSDLESPDSNDVNSHLKNMQEESFPADKCFNFETPNLIPTLSKVKSLSLSDLTQDNKINLQSKIQSCKSDTNINSATLPDYNVLTCIPMFEGDTKAADDSDQFLVELFSKSETLSKEPSSTVTVSNTGRLKSLSLSDLTNDIPSANCLRRCKSVTGSTHTTPLITSNYFEDRSEDTDSEYLPQNNIFGDCSTDSEFESNNDEVFYGDLNEGRKRRRKAVPSQWAKNKAKEMRMKGEQYLGFRKPPGESVKHDTVRPARQLGPTCSSDFCRRSKLRGCSQFTEDVRKKIHSNFWKTLNWDQRKIFVTGLVSRSTTNRKTVKNESRRTGTLQYTLPLNARGDEKVQVCREMFLNTLSLGAFTVQDWVKKAEFGMSAHQALLNSSRIVTRSEEVKAKLVGLEDFFNKLPKLPSHYGRQNTSKLFLEPIYNTLTCLFKVYKEYCISQNIPPVGRYVFEKTFKEKKLSLFTLKKDMCDLCSSYAAGNMNEADYNLHIIMKNRARQEKSDDKIKADRKEFILLTMDLEAVKVCPFLTASSLYYKTKLTCHNFTVYNVISHHCTCYWFNETTADMTASTFTSMLVDYIERHCLPLKLPIIIFSDGCTYQNRNVVLANALLNLSKLHGITIIQKFLVPGHTQMECDSVHSAIERKLKNKEIHLPSEYCTATKEARKDPYEVIEIDHTFVKNYADSDHSVYKSIRPGRKTGDPQVVDIRAIKYTPESVIQIKLNFDDVWIDLPQRPKVVNHNEAYQQLHSGRLPIKTTKYDHLQQLKLVIPKDCHAFYDNLPKTS